MVTDEIDEDTIEVTKLKTFEAKIHEVKTKYKQIYVDKVHEIEKYFNGKFRDLNEEHEANI